MHQSQTFVTQRSSNVVQKFQDDMKGYLMSTDATLVQCEALCENASSQHLAAELPEHLRLEHTLRPANWNQQEPATGTGHLREIPDNSGQPVAPSDNCSVSQTSGQRNTVLPELLQTRKAGHSLQLRGDLNQERAIDASLRSWVPPCTSHDSAPPFPFPRRNDSAMQSNRHTKTSPSMSTKIPCAPSPGSLNGVSLAPIDSEAFSRIPGVRNRHKQHRKSLRSSFDIEFQDLANDPEVLAMILTKDQCRMHMSPNEAKSHTPVSEATGDKTILQGLSSNFMQRKDITQSDHPHLPCSKALLKCWQNRAEVKPPISKYKSEGTVFSSESSSAQVKERNPARRTSSRQMLPHHSIQTDVSDEVRGS